MKSVVCVEPGKLVVEERPEPAVKEGWIKLGIRRIGICGTDFHIYSGSHPFLEYPRVMGHELSGEVLDAPVGSKFAAGQQVIVNPYLPCGECVSCRKGKPNCCVNIQVLGVHTDGGLCEFIYVPEEALYPIDGLSLSQASMVEFLSIGAHAVRRAEINKGDKVLVVGAGPIGLGAALFASLIEQTEITILDVNEKRIENSTIIPNSVGVVAAGDMQEVFAKSTNGDMFDVVLDATGNKRAMEASLAYVAHGGTCVFISVVKDDITFSDPSFHAREIKLVASRNATKVDFEHVIASIKRGAVPIDALNTHTASLEELPEKMVDWIGQQDTLIKAIVHV